MSAIILQGYVTSNKIVTQGYSFNTDTPPIGPSADPSTYTLTISEATGGFTVPTAGTYTHGEGATVTVTAVPYDPEYTFTAWTVNGVTETVNPIDIAITANVTLTPIFTATSFIDTITPFDEVLIKLEANNAETLFDQALTVMERIDASTLFDRALTQIEQAATQHFELATDESVIFDDQVFDEEPFYEDG